MYFISIQMMKQVNRAIKIKFTTKLMVIFYAIIVISLAHQKYNYSLIFYVCLIDVDFSIIALYLCVFALFILVTWWFHDFIHYILSMTHSEKWWINKMTLLQNFTLSMYKIFVSVILITEMAIKLQFNFLHLFMTFNLCLITQNIETTAEHWYRYLRNVAVIQKKKKNA